MTWGKRLYINVQRFGNQAVVVWLPKNNVTMFFVLAFRTIVFHKTADITITYSEKGAGSS
jgi:hypothetical protein